MTPERWQQVKSVLDSALLMSANTRASYVADACGNDRELRQEVELLLASHEEAASHFVKTPIARLAGPPPRVP